MMNYYQFRAMNSDIVLSAEGPDDWVAVGFQEVRAFIENSEQRFTRFSDQSELSQLNQAAGNWFYASDDLYDLVAQARQFVDQTGGLFDPSILEALKVAGYDRSMDDIRSFGPGPDTLPLLWKPAGFSGVQFDPADRAIFLPAGVQINLGGIAKGWIAQKAAYVLSGRARACAVSAGGDIFLIGLPSGQPAWEIALEDPRDSEKNLAILHVGPGAVATSAITKRRWTQGEKARHHIIDPRTGQPARTDWLSVTAIASTATVAEVFAKALLIAGSEQSHALAAKEPDLTFIGVRNDGTLWGSSNSQEIIHGTA